MKALPLIVLLAGCSNLKTADAVLVDDLCLDGCSYVLEIASSRYAPEEASKPLVRDFPHACGVHTRVRIGYVETGAMALVDCGFAPDTQLPAISIASISRAP